MKMIITVWLAMLAIVCRAQTPVNFPLQNMFGGPYNGSVACNALQGIYTDGTNLWIAQPSFGIQTNGCSSLVIPCAPNNYWIQFGQYGFGFFVPSGLGTNNVNIFSFRVLLSFQTILLEFLFFHD